LWSPEVNTNVSYTLGSGTTLGLFYKFTGKQPAYQASIDAQGNATARLTEIGSFHWADFTITQKLKHGFQLNAGVKNLANVTRLNNTGTSSGSAHSTSGPVPMSYGRSYFAGITYQIHQ
jgi:outer membrane receptor for ferrienterochelin and colicins